VSEHRQRYNFCEVTYWKGNTASLSGGDWTSCKVSPRGAYTHGEQSFANDEQGIYARDSLIRFLEKAYECGRSDAKREIRDVLGVKDPRP
jgi:hypothetical protein